jgi:hypothetical protein
LSSYHQNNTHKQNPLSSNLTNCPETSPLSFVGKKPQRQMNPFRPHENNGTKQKRKKKIRKTTHTKDHMYYSSDKAWNDDYVPLNPWLMNQQPHVLEENWGIEADCNPYNLYPAAG